MIASTSGNTSYTFHQLANEWPLLSGKPFDDLVEDIRKNGLCQPISVNTDNEILDGRNRYRACIEAGINPRVEVVTDVITTDQIEAFIATRNLHRRHQSQEELATIVQKMQAKGKSLREIEAETGIKRSKASRLTKSKRGTKSQDGSLSPNGTVSQEAETIVQVGKSIDGGPTSPPPPRRLTAEEGKAIDRDLAAGKSLRETAEANGVSVGTVKKRKAKLTKPNGHVAGKRLSQKQMQEITAAYQMGEPVDKLARRFRVSKSRIIETAREMYSQRSTAEMIDHLRSVFDPTLNQKFHDACDDYRLPSDHREAIEDYLSRGESVEPSGDLFSIDVEALDAMINDYLNRAIGSYHRLSAMASDKSRQVLTIHARLLTVRESIAQLMLEFSTGDDTAVDP